MDLVSGRVGAELFFVVRLGSWPGAKRRGHEDSATRE
jgi:hypothetical protein